VGHDNEESCTTYNFLKIVRLLFEWSANPAYLDMYSHALTNGVLGRYHCRHPRPRLHRCQPAPVLLVATSRVYEGDSTNGVLGIQNPSEPGVMIYLLPLGNGVTKGNSSRSWGSPLNSFVSDVTTRPLPPTRSASPLPASVTAHCGGHRHSGAATGRPRNHSPNWLTPSTSGSS
jgi:hypothetical protein